MDDWDNGTLTLYLVFVCSVASIYSFRLLAGFRGINPGMARRNQGKGVRRGSMDPRGRRGDPSRQAAECARLLP